MAGMRVDRHVLTSLMLENAFTSKNKGCDSRGEGNWKKLGENPVAHSEERVEEEWIINYSSRGRNGLTVNLLPEFQDFPSVIVGFN